MKEKNFVVEGYSLDAIEYFLKCLKSPQGRQRHQAYVRLCRVALETPKTHPSDEDIDSLYYDVENNIVRLLKQEIGIDSAE